METTTDFPLDLKCSLLITREDAITYEQIKQLSMEADLAKASKKGEVQVIND